MFLKKKNAFILETQIKFIEPNPRKHGPKGIEFSGKIRLPSVSHVLSFGCCAISVCRYVYSGGMIIRQNIPLRYVIMFIWKVSHRYF